MQQIYLEVDEEITSVIDKIRKIKETEICLIFPKEAVIIRSIVSLKLLKKQAENLSKKIIISTIDEIGLNLAKRVGFSIVPQTKKGGILLEENQSDESETQKENLEKRLLDVELAEKQKKTEKEREKEIKNKEKKKRVSLISGIGIKFLILILIFAAVLSYLIFFILPKAQIKIVQKTEDKNYELDLTIDGKASSLDFEKNIMSGKMEVRELDIPKKKFYVKGEKEVGDKAKGEIVVYNKYSSESQVLPKETKFKTGDKIFISLSDFEIPGAKVEGGQTISGKVKVGVEAEKGGIEYNIRPSVFSIISMPVQQQNSIWGESRTKFSGGTSKKIKALNENDLKQAREELTKDGGKLAEEEIKKSLKDDKMLISGSGKIELLSAKSDTKIDQEAALFEIEAKVRTKIIGFLKKDLEDIIFSYIEKKEESKKIIVDRNLNNISFEIKNFDETGEKLLVKIKIKKIIAEKLNLETEKTAVLGLSEKEAENKLLENPKIKEISILFWPMWVNKMPKNSQKIEISVEQKIE